MLNDKAIVITGAGRGIGGAIARAAASLGARVVVNDLDGEAAEAMAAEIRKKGGEALVHAADIADWKSAGRLIEACVSRWGRIDGLVNNAGLFRLARLEEQTERDARAMVKVNVMGTLACAAHAIAHMKAQGSGSIVNVTSGAQMGLPAMGAYGATKGAVASLTYAWAAENAGSGIRVNALSPFAASAMTEERNRYFGDKLGIAEPPPEVNAPVVCFLLSDRAAAVNGQIVRMEGRNLSLVVHPGIAMPVLEDDWTVETIAEAFDRELGARQFPTGVVGMKVEIADYGSPMWSDQKKGGQSGNPD